VTLFRRAEGSDEEWEEREDERSTTLKLFSDGMNEIVPAGDYGIEIEAAGNVPHAWECALMDVDLQILPKRVMTTRAGTCTSSSGFPSLINYSGSSFIQLYESEKLNKYIDISLKHPAKIVFELTYDNALSGLILM
jgi:hypothetical protein